MLPSPLCWTLFQSPKHGSAPACSLLFVAIEFLTKNVGSLEVKYSPLPVQDIQVSEVRHNLQPVISEKDEEYCEEEEDEQDPDLCQSRVLHLLGTSQHPLTNTGLSKSSFSGKIILTTQPQLQPQFKKLIAVQPTTHHPYHQLTVSIMMTSQHYKF